MTVNHGQKYGLRDRILSEEMGGHSRTRSLAVRIDFLN